MFETNEEIVQKLKQTICDYYMGYIKQKINGGKENEISNQIMQFLDAQMDTGNSTINKEDIIRILMAVLFEDNPNPSDEEIEHSRIPYCFPSVSEIKIEDGGAAYLTEKHETLFNGIEEKSCYLYVSPDYYNKNIENIENNIRILEKGFSRQDLKGFEEKFERDLSLKQYELESAKVYESASKQIELKKQKFNNISQKMINEYGKKYDEIMEKDLEQEKKHEGIYKLFEETKAYDEKNRQAVSRLNSEYEQLSNNFQGKVQDVKTIHAQMQNLHLFDKNRYFEDMKSDITPELRELYRKRYLLNSYRTLHNEQIFSGKPNVFASFFENFSKHLNKNNMPLALGPHFERDFPSEINENINQEATNKNLVKALAGYYSNASGEYNEEYENTLVQYFKEHYNELMQNNENGFLLEFSKEYEAENTENVKTSDLFKIAEQFGINTQNYQNNFGANLIVKDELIYEKNTNGLNIIYATDKAVNGIVNDLYGEALYHSHLAKENAQKANLAANLRAEFITYANNNDINLGNTKNLNTQKRYIKKKHKAESKIIDFRQESC